MEQAAFRLVNLWTGANLQLLTPLPDFPTSSIQRAVYGLRRR
jgi:hypothetical protein